MSCSPSQLKSNYRRVWTAEMPACAEETRPLAFPGVVPALVFSIGSRSCGVTQP
jgi:hypothetical protein